MKPGRMWCIKSNKDLMVKLKPIAFGNYNCFWCVFLVLAGILVFSIHYSAFGVDNNGLDLNNIKRGQSLPVRETVELDGFVNENEQVHAKFIGERRAEDKSCRGRYIYMHDLPARFNDDLLKNCSSLIKWSDFCQSASNLGLGARVRKHHNVLQDQSWYETNQFALEIIFHNRMKRYKCLTGNSSLASAVYVPFYPGLEVGRYLWGGFNTSVRDSLSLDLAEWLAGKPEWSKMWGRDHFFVGGRITWDFRRNTDENSAWGNKLLLLPEVKNMTALIIESSPWSNVDFSIPYPTYFHPSTDEEVFRWQSKILRRKRPYLFSFVGAPRPSMKDSVRGKIISQCLASGPRTCKLMECYSGGINCQNPVHVIKMLRSSVFCLQPSGDSYTRRSMFDSILAGCIPVFFHPGSAYVQYIWYLPLNYTKYSVFIPENNVKDGRANIKKILRGISEAEVRAMRKEVISLIPRVIYANPASNLEAVEDAFDIAVKGVLDRVEGIKREMKEGKNSSFEFPQEKSWKYYHSGTMGEHEWDYFFTDQS